MVQSDQPDSMFRAERHAECNDESPLLDKVLDRVTISQPARSQSQTEWVGYRRLTLGAASRTLIGAPQNPRRGVLRVHSKRPHTWDNESEAQGNRLCCPAVAECSFSRRQELAGRQIQIQVHRVVSRRQLRARRSVDLLGSHRAAEYSRPRGCA